MLVEYLKDVIIAVVTSFAGYVVYKMKQRDADHRAHEEEQNKKMEHLDRRLTGVEARQQVQEERDRHIQEDLKEIKQDLKTLINKNLRQ